MNQQELKKVLEYNPVNGLFFRRIRTSNRINEGDIAGSRDKKGYICIRVYGKTYKAHRLAWLYMKGSWPEYEIDHINGIKDDNRIINLRDVEKHVNQQNRFNIKGYSKDGNRWKAQIRVNRKWIHLGCFGTEKEAHDEYIKAKKRYHIQAREE